MRQVLLLLLVPFFLFANKPEYAVDRIAEELLEDANAVIRANTIEFEVHSPGTATLKERMVVTRLNDKASYEKLYVDYSNYTKISSLTANIYDANGKLIRKIKKNEIEDIAAYSGSTIAQDYRNKYIDFSYGNYPYTIEYLYEKEYSEIMLYPNWEVQRFKTAVEFSQYILSLPSSIEVQTKLHNLDIEAVQKIEKSNKKQVWQAKDIAAVVKESRMPEPRKKLALGLFAPSNFKVAGYTGDMTSWESIGAFFYELNKGRDQLSPEMVRTVQNLTRDAKTEEEKIDILYRYMQENMRYVSIQLGIGGWQTFHATYVEQNKFGDCKALSNFMKAMLKVIDIKSYTAIVYGGRSVPYDVTEDFARPMFNHAILHVPSTDYWLECTSTDNPPNHLGVFTEDRNVLLITEEGGKLVRTPKSNPEINFERHNTHIQVNEKGQALLKDEIAIGGLDYDYYQSFITYYKSEAEQKKQFLEGSSLPLSQLVQLDIQLEKDVPKGSVQTELEIAHYASRSGKRLFIPINLNNQFTSIPDVDENRINPVLIRNSYTELDTIRIQLPETVSIESVPKAVHIASEYGSYQMQFETKGNEVQCFRSLKMLSKEIPADQYTDWRAFCKKIARSDKAKLVATVN